MSSAPREPIAGIGRYKVGTVARLTGLSPHLIRAWERRYGAVEPQRTRAGTRIYSDSDVARLQLLKALVDLGEPVGRIARLPVDALRARLTPPASPYPEAARDDAGPARLALLCPRLSVQIEANPTALGGIEVVADAPDFERYLEALKACRPDVLVMALDALDSDPIECIERCRERAPEAALYAVHGFTPRQVLEQLGSRGVHLARAPLRVSLLRQLVLGARDIRDVRRLREAVEKPPAPGALLEAHAAPRFGDAQLAELMEVRSSVACECPSQIAHLVQDLLAFERYSQRCAVEAPRDAELHGLLARGTGHARSLMEELLARVCEHDGIAVRQAAPLRGRDRRDASD